MTKHRYIVSQQTPGGPLPLINTESLQVAKATALDALLATFPGASAVTVTIWPGDNGALSMVGGAYDQPAATVYIDAQEMSDSDAAMSAWRRSHENDPNYNWGD